MSIDFNAAELAELDADTQRIGVFFRLDTDPVVRLWMGVGDCDAGINAYDFFGGTYSGLGQLLDVPTVQMLINGIADRVTFNLSGVSADVVNLARSEASATLRKAVALGIAIFDRDWQKLGVIRWLFRGVADSLTVAQASQSDSAGGVAFSRTVQLSVGSLFTTRRRRGFSFLTNFDQQGRAPGPPPDRICERTVLYSNSNTKVWPRFTPP